MQKGTLMVYEFGHCEGRAPLKALGLVTATRGEGAGLMVQVQPVFWTVGSPLTKWLRWNSPHISAVLNGNVSQLEAKASA